MACPLCGDDCHCSWVPPRTTAPAGELRASISSKDDDIENDDSQFAGAAEEQFASAAANDVIEEQIVTGIQRHMQEERALEQQADCWRDEIASKIEIYKQKRSRKRLSGDFSMRFDFEQPAHSPRAAQAAAASAAATAAALAPEPLYEVYDEPLPPSIPAQPDVEHAMEVMTDSVWAPQPQHEFEPEPEHAAAPEPLRSNIIEFPRLPFMYTPSADELAEPVFDLPRILDVPEDVPTGAPMSDIRLESDEEPVMASEIEVPLQVAPTAQRFVASVVDWGIVLTTSLAFFGVAWRLSPGIAFDKMTLAGAVVSPVMFWAVYQFLFLVYCERTPGMQAMRLSARTFDGEAPGRGARKWRALMMVLSCMPLGLGFAWALADEDMLCWHDRITRTYLTNSR